MDVRCVLVLVLVAIVGCGRLGYDAAPLNALADAEAAPDAAAGDAAARDAVVLVDGGAPVDPSLQRSLAELTYAAAPPQLRCPVMASDPSTGRVVLYGGFREDVPYDGMWELRPDGWTPCAKATAPRAPGAGTRSCSIA